MRIKDFQRAAHLAAQVLAGGESGAVEPEGPAVGDLAPCGLPPR
ncbi:hypothetical protein [Streptomyces sp. XD-27]|nr:hypothetical protein [Streptomyces sp. XD-27]WKX69699.1 hypothetical protein Q3Y56_07060 [Streptomyces sp. XD-27]